MEAGCWCWGSEHTAGTRCFTSSSGPRRFGGQRAGAPQLCPERGKGGCGQPGHVLVPLPHHLPRALLSLGVPRPREQFPRRASVSPTPSGQRSTTRAERPHFRGIPRGALSPLSDTISQVPACTPAAPAPFPPLLAPGARAEPPAPPAASSGSPPSPPQTKEAFPPPHLVLPLLRFLSGSFFSLFLFFFFPREMSCLPTDVTKSTLEMSATAGKGPR